LRSWGSAETVVDFPEHCCVICKEVINLVNTAQLSQDKTVIIDKSTTFLMCKDCINICHVHCHLNLETVTADILVDTIQKFQLDVYYCPECQPQ
jgi:hypothetical protein